MSGQHDKSLGHILLVDDEQHITDLLQYNLESEHYKVTVAVRAADVPAMDLDDVRLLVADAMSQDFTGLDLLRSLKASPRTASIPVIILAHSDSEDDILEAFDAGAEDYVFKPFSLRELFARIRAVLRRHPLAEQTAARASLLTFGPMTVDPLTCLVTVDGVPVSLTKTEYAILSLLARNQGQTYSRREIYDEIWRDIDRPNNDRIVDTNISRLSKKLGSAAPLIRNKTGFGYTLN